jgi:hypothetical protein
MHCESCERSSSESVLLEIWNDVAQFARRPAMYGSLDRYDSFYVGQLRTLGFIDRSLSQRAWFDEYRFLKSKGHMEHLGTVEILRIHTSSEDDAIQAYVGLREEAIAECLGRRLVARFYEETHTAFRQRLDDMLYAEGKDSLCVFADRLDGTIRPIAEREHMARVYDLPLDPADPLHAAVLQRTQQVLSQPV